MESSKIEVKLIIDLTNREAKKLFTSLLDCIAEAETEPAKQPVKTELVKKAVKQPVKTELVKKAVKQPVKTELVKKAAKQPAETGKYSKDDIRQKLEPLTADPVTKSKLRAKLNELGAKNLTLLEDVHIDTLMLYILKLELEAKAETNAEAPQ